MVQGYRKSCLICRVAERKNEMDPDEERTEELREKLIDYYGTAMACGVPMAAYDLARIEDMSPEEIEREAEKNHIR